MCCEIYLIWLSILIFCFHMYTFSFTLLIIVTLCSDISEWHIVFVCISHYAERVNWWPMYCCVLLYLFICVTFFKKLPNYRMFTNGIFMTNFFFCNYVLIAINDTLCNKRILSWKVYFNWCHQPKRFDCSRLSGSYLTILNI